MRYKIILDKDILEEFVDNLPDLELGEKYYISLFARKKYDPNTINSSDRVQLGRSTVRKEHIINKLMNWEIPLGAYKLKGRDVTQKSLAVYINPNPRSTKKAAIVMQHKLIDLLHGANEDYNIVREAYSAMQKSKSRGIFVDFDLDVEKPFDLSPMESILPKYCYDILETRGGYHILVNTQKVKEGNKIFRDLRDTASHYGFDRIYKMWYKDIQNAFPVDKTGDQMIPIPGTHQGGFMPQFIKEPIIEDSIDVYEE